MDREEMEERVLKAAGRMFSQLGYDATTLEMIAGAVGRGSECSELLQRGKQGLYREVFAYIYKLSEDRMRTALEKASDDAGGLHYTVDEYIDLILEHPEIPALWKQRGLLDAVDIDFPEEHLQPPLQAALTSRRWEGTRPDLDLKFLSWLVMWSMGGFIDNGLPDDSGQCHLADHPPTLQYFRARLHEMIDRMA
ncbi:hypothetical protein ABGB12_22995 [Actinocorallia sp. B10E7]|uniref:TetR/AcrR family transcriptional regulator n=1 Tax=Actinocorallia sp. B10E7 TaxID=3153558 RepID=UPI00325F5BEF